MDPSMEMYVAQLNRCLMPQAAPATNQAPHSLQGPNAVSMEMISRALYSHMAASFNPCINNGWIDTAASVLGAQARPTMAPAVENALGNKPQTIPQATGNGTDKKRKTGGTTLGCGMWRKYGQKRMKGKEFEGLDVFRCYFKCTAPGCQVRMQTEKHSWQTDEEARCVVRGTHTHPVQAQDNVRQDAPLRIVQALAPNTPRIDNHFLTRVKQNKPFFSVIDSSNSFRIIYVSDTFEAGTGYSMGSVRNKGMFFMAGEQTDPKTIETIKSAIQKNQCIKQQLILYKKSGEPIWVEMMVDSVGTPPYNICLQTNITKPEEKKKKKLSSLQRIVEENQNTHSSNDRIESREYVDKETDRTGSGESVDNSGGTSGGGTDSGEDLSV